MPRQARQRSRTGIYHVMMRGIDRATVFHDDEDCEKFLDVLRACRVPLESIRGQDISPSCAVPLWGQSPDGCMHYPLLAEKARYFKEDEEGVATMCKAMEDMRNEAAWQKTVEIVCRLLEMGLPHEQIAQGAGITLEQVKEIAGQRSA